VRQTFVRAIFCIAVLTLFGVYAWTKLEAPDGTVESLESQSDDADSPAATTEDAGGGDNPRQVTGPARPNERSATVERDHPLLRKAEAMVLADKVDEVPSTAGSALAESIHALVRSAANPSQLAPLTVDYPLDESVFPPEIVPPTFLWHEPTERADTWLIDVAFAAGQHLSILTPGDPPPSGEIDPRAVADSNEVYQPTAYQASAKTWTPTAEIWAAIKQRSMGEPARITISGFHSGEATSPLSQARITMTTSTDPVGAPIFYRDVPLAPSATEDGVIKPLSEAVVPMIAWRLRDISKPDSRLLLTDMLNCTNCHSFSADGKTLGMDLDGPKGDKGAYIIAPVAKQMVIEQKHVISWNSFPDKPKDHKTIGFLSQMSPDGQFAVTTLNESVFVSNFWDYKFLQVFYPTRGILGYYRRATGEIKALPGADDPRYVHCDPAWAPDGKYLVFARAAAVDPYPPGRPRPTHANDAAETPVQYDLYRLPFNDGLGGQPKPVEGASRNGMSNNFPKVSPDGKWIVFVQCRNGQLLRPDSKLWIVSSSGGTPRLMRCNTSRMNSWHSFSPNSRWLVFSSKANTPYTEMFLTHIDEQGNDSPPILIPQSTAANRAVNLPEFVNIPYEGLANISVPAVQHLRYALRGREFLEKKNLDEALGEFDKALASQPDYVDGHVTAAVILIEQGMHAEAAEHLHKAIQLDPKCWYAYANLGVISQRQGKLDEAAACFETAVKLKPDHFESHANLGKILLEKGMPDRAKEHFRAAAQIDPQDAASHANLGRYLLQRALFEEAAAQFEACLASHPRFIDARLMLGRALAAEGKYAEALGHFGTACEMEPGNLQAVNDLAWLLATCPQNETRNGSQAVQLAEAACRLSSYQDPVLMNTLAAAYAELGKWPEAVATASKALELAKPRDAVLAQEIGQLLERYRRGEAAR